MINKMTTIHIKDKVITVSAVRRTAGNNPEMSHIIMTMNQDVKGKGETKVTVGFCYLE